MDPSQRHDGARSHRSIRAATRADLEAVRSLLAACALPDAGLEEQFPGGYLVAWEEGNVVGSVGIEVHGNDGLLRSLAVSPGRRGNGVGADLVARGVALARERGLAGLYLLTETAAPFFARLGFRVIERSSAPGAVRGSVEFESACPESATAMALPLHWATDAG